MTVAHSEAPDALPIAKLLVLIDSRFFAPGNDGGAVLHYGVTT